VVRASLDLWCESTGETLHPEAGISLNTGVFAKPLGPDELALVQKLYDGKLLSRKTALWLIDKAGLLPPEVNPEDEAQRLKDEEPEEPTLPPVAAFGQLDDEGPLLPPTPKPTPAPAEAQAA